ncbi:MAG: monofunctional biosynthetic peptidoglycan transglycosylase [Pseudomonadota bacterium]
MRWLRRIRRAVLRGLRRLLVRSVRLGLRLGLWVALVCVIWVLAYRWVNPPATPYMLSEAWRLGGVEQRWVALDTLPAHVPLSLAAAEDAGFCAHFGVDLDAIADAWSDTSRLRGGSTITQQVAKNAFLWQGRSWLRKGLEAGFAGLIELFWPKRRIMEVYLNIAEMDVGAFGVEAAARRYFAKPATALTSVEAALIASLLPDPKDWSAADPTRYLRDRAASVRDGAATLARDGRGGCVMPR